MRLSQPRHPDRSGIDRLGARGFGFDAGELALDDLVGLGTLVREHGVDELSDRSVRERVAGQPGF